MKRRRAVEVVGRLTATGVLAGFWLLLFATPASADNCNVRINPRDCQNTAWTVGSVAAIAAAATAAAVALTGTWGGGASTGERTEAAEGIEGTEAAEGTGAATEAEGEGAAVGVAPEPPPPLTDILDGERAIKVLQEMGLAVAVPQPDGSVRYFPAGGFHDLNADGRTTFEDTASSVDQVTGRTDWIQERTITRIGGIAWNENPDGSLGNPVIVVEHTPPSDWQRVNEVAPGVRAQGNPQFVQETTAAYNQVVATAAGRQIISDISASGQQVRIRQETDHTAGNSYGAFIGANRFQNADGTHGLGSGGNVWFDPSRVQTGDGSRAWHARPPSVGLAHELAHARDAAQGNQALGTTQDPMAPPHPAHPDAWEINNREAQATSIGVYAGHTSDENAVRQQMGQPPRGSYAL